MVKLFPDLAVIKIARHALSANWQDDYDNFPIIFGDKTLSAA
jgi:hypothetical protein